METVYWPLGLYVLAVMVVIGGMLGLSHFLGERHATVSDQEPFESGMRPTGSARLRFPVTFYVVALLFVIFDLEAMFILAWAAAFADLGWPGYGLIAAFIAVLLATLVYLIREGALVRVP